MRPRPITPEQLRIMVAAAEGRLKLSEAYRYVIEGEDPPNRRERERLQKRGLISRPRNRNLVFTEKGLDALARAPVMEEAPKAEQLMIEAPHG